MIFHVLCEPACVRIKGGTLRHRPTHEDAVDLEPEVVMQAPGPMTLDDEAVIALAGATVATARLRRRAEVALRPVLAQ